MAKKHHKFKHSHIEWHDDGSATLHHQHEDPKHDVKHAAADHDSAMDSIMDHTSPMNPGEAEPQAALTAAGPAGAVAPPAAV